MVFGNLLLTIQQLDRNVFEGEIGTVREAKQEVDSMGNQEGIPHLIAYSVVVASCQPEAAIGMEHL